jgi:hypothetical protein
MAGGRMKKPLNANRAAIYIIVSAVAILAMLALARRTWDSFLGNEPIRFYGRIVDPSGTPIGGVTVDIKILHYASFHLLGAGHESESVETVTSDSNGEFELTSGSGHSFVVGGFRKENQRLELAYPPRDIRRPMSSFVYSDAVNKAQIPDTPARRLDYPVHGKI